MDEVGSEANDAFLSFAKKIIMSALSTIGWEQKSAETDIQKEVRAIVISLVASFCSTEESVLSTARDLFEKYFASFDENILPADFKGSVFRIVLTNGGEREYGMVLSQYETATSDETRRWAISTLGYTPTADAKAKVMEWAVSSGVKLQDCYTPMLSVSSSGKDGADIAWHFFKTNFDRIKGFAGGGNAWTLQGVIVCCTGGFSSEDKAVDIEAFFAANPVPNATRKISQTVEKIRINAGFVEKVKTSKLISASFWSDLA